MSHDVRTIPLLVTPSRLALGPLLAVGRMTASPENVEIDEGTVLIESDSTDGDFGIQYS